MTRTGELVKAMLTATDGATGSDSRGPLDRILKSFRPFPVDALPDPVAGVARSIAGATGTDPAWAALAALAVMAGCVGNRAAVVLKNGWVEPAILWAALVGKSGSTKSVVLRLVTRPLVELFKMERDAFQQKVQEYSAEIGRYQVELARWRSDQRKGPPTDPPVEPERPREHRLLVSDITVEKLASLLGENPLGLLVLRDELAGLVNSFNRYAGGKGSDLQSWLSMNDGGPLLVDRKSDGSTFVERASVSVLGTIQPFTLANVFGSLEREAGLLARILLAYPPDQPALWRDDELPEEVVTDWRALLASLLQLVPVCDDAGRPRPRLIGLARDAKSRFISWHDQHAREVAALADDHQRAHWSKLKGCCARFALLFSCGEAVRGASVPAVTLGSIERAIEITEWFKFESGRVYGGLRMSDEDRDRLALCDWIRQRGGSVSVRDLAHGLWKFRGKAAAARAALDDLAAGGLGRWSSAAPCVRGGRPAETFELHPNRAITITKTRCSDSAGKGIGDGDGA